MLRELLDRAPGRVGAIEMAGDDIGQLLRAFGGDWSERADQAPQVVEVSPNLARPVAREPLRRTDTREIPARKRVSSSPALVGLELLQCKGANRFEQPEPGFVRRRVGHHQ